MSLVRPYRVQTIFIEQGQSGVALYNVPNLIDFPRYNMKCNGENVILRGIVHVVSGFPLHFMLYRGNLDCFLNSVQSGLCSWSIPLIYCTPCQKPCCTIEYTRVALGCTLPPVWPRSYLIKFLIRNLSNSPCSEPSRTVLFPDVMFTRHPS